MEQNNNTITIKQLAEILIAHIGQIKLEDCKEVYWASGKRFSLDIPLAELDAKYGGALSECLVALSNKVGNVNSFEIVHALNPCLADVNANENEKYAKLLRALEQNGVAVSRQLYDWEMSFPLWFYKDTKTLKLYIIGWPKKM